MNLQNPVASYTVPDRASGIYKIAVDVFDWSKTSDCVTPLEVAQRQFAGCDSCGTVCIPGAGIGTYVVAALQAGFKPEDITAVELDPAYFELGSAIYRRFGVNYVLADFLDWNPQMQFDVIIGNPPYQKSKYSDFYVCFMRKSAELLREGGYFSMIAPAKGAQPLSRAQKPLEQVGWNRVEFGVESYFPNIGTVIANYVGTKGYNGQRLTVMLSGEEFTVNKGTVFPLDSHDKLSYSVVAKIFGCADKMPFVRQKVEPTGKYLYVSRLIGTWHPDKPKGGPYALKAFVNEAPELNDGGFIICDSDQEVKHAAWAVTRSLVMRFAINQCGKAAFIAPMFWSLMPNLLECETDADTFKKLKLTKEEINYIKSWEKTTYRHGCNRTNRA
jgi:methylase of polypeptide subunit release factors